MAVYCIDNVSTDASVGDIALFVSKMGVTVLKCNGCNPRRTRWQWNQGIMPTDRNAFRICIPREESEKFLCADRWPAHIGITPWIFRKRKPGHPEQHDNAPTERTQSGAQSLQQQRVTTHSTPAATTGGATVVAAAAAAAASAAARDRSDVTVGPPRPTSLSTSTPALEEGAEMEERDVAMTDPDLTFTDNNNGGD
jgi:hypothetical protein